jgi:thioredoxin-dependent peroxiredoxin
MTLQIGEAAPNFSARSTHGAFRFYSWMDRSWVVLLTYPRTITPDFAKEIGTVERLQAEFEQRRCKIMGLAVEPVDDLDEWLAHIAAVSGQTPSYPLIGSADMHVARLFDLIRDDAAQARTMRRMIVIDPDRRVKLSVAYPMVTDAIFGEILQMIEALQAARGEGEGVAAGSDAGNNPDLADLGPDAADAQDIGDARIRRRVC